MKSRPLGVESILATDHNTRRDDARGGSFLLVHQQLGALALPTNPTNGQTLTITVNSTAIVITYVTSLGSTPNNILIQGTAALTAAATVNFLRRPDLTNANQIAATIPNQALLFYLGYSLPSGATTITPFSLNKNVNGASANLSSFTASTTVTSASWTAQTMELYVEDGTYYIGSTRVLFLGGSTPTFTAPVSNPRIDLVTADSTGTIAIVGGTESASPVAPTYPANKAVLAEIYHVVGETALYDTENQQSGQGYVLNDVRPVMNGGGYISSPTQIAAGIVIFDPGSEAQGDLLYYNGSAWARLPAGTSGQVLTTKGPSANPVYSSPTAGYHGAGSANGTNYQTSLTAYADVDATNLKFTIAGLTVGQFVMVRIFFQAANSGTSTTNAVALMDVTNSTVVYGVTPTASTAGYGFDGLYKIQSASTTFSLQYKTTSGTCTVINSAVAWVFTTGGQTPAMAIIPLN